MVDVLDEFTSVDESVEGLATRLDEIGSLLEAQSGGTGEYNPVPFEAATFPREGGRMALPPGKTVLNFGRGKVQNEHEGDMYDLRDLDEMGSGVDSLGSFYVYSDVSALLRVDDGETWNLSSGQFTHIKTPGFDRVTIEPRSYGMPYTVYGVASTRGQPYAQPDSLTANVSREGNLSAGTWDSWTPMNWQPQELTEWVNQNGDTDPWAYADTDLDVVSAPTKTLQVENTSGNGNDIDVRLMASSTPAMDWFEVDRVTALSDGDHQVFHVEQVYERMQVEVRNSTDGNTVSSIGQMTGVSQ